MAKKLQLHGSFPTTPGPQGEKGEPGKDGGYYTPTITLLEDGTAIQIDYDRSDSAMPALFPVAFELPIAATTASDVYTQPDEPVDARDGSLWVDLDAVETPSGGPDSGQSVALTATERSTLIAVVNAIGVFDAPNGQALIDAFNAAWSGAGSGDIPGEPEQPAKTLVSISAAYSGGDVAVGTAVADLTGIVVTAHYSDGSTAVVTGYTLSGTIAEGSNTITVTYQGQTATITVTGVAESGGGDATNLYSGQYLKSVNIESHTENGNVLTYTPTQNGSSITYTIEGLEADKEYTIFVESTRTDGGCAYTQVSVNTGSAASYDGKLVSLYPSYKAAGKNYATFTANGKTMYFWCAETGANVGGTTPTLTVYIYEGTLTEKP